LPCISGDPAPPIDQAWIETFFGHLKAEFPHLLKITEPAVLRAGLDHLQIHWNTVRLHAGVGYVTRRRWRSLLTAIESIVVHEGLRLNPAKTRMRQRHQRQVVTGIVVNNHPNLARPEFDRLRAILHDCRQHGPAVANRQQHNNFRAHLLGRISWVAALNPAHGARLRATFDAITWEQ